MEFPDSKALLEVHQDLSQFEKLKQGVDNGEVPALADSSKETLALAQQLLTHIEALQRLRDEVVQAHRPWTVAMRERLRRGSNDNLVPMLEALGADLENGSPPIRLRSRGPQSFEEIPPSELQVVANYLAQRHGFSSGSDEHLRAVLECFDLKRLTTQVGTTLLEILERRFPYVDEFINRIPK